MIKDFKCVKRKIVTGVVIILLITCAAQGKTSKVNNEVIQTPELFSVWSQPRYMSLGSNDTNVYGMVWATSLGTSNRMFGISLGGINHLFKITGISADGYFTAGNKSYGPLLKKPQKNIDGVAIGAILAGADELTGVAASGFQSGAEKLTGVAISGVGVAASELSGVAISGVGVKLDKLTGFAFATLNTEVKKKCIGLQCAMWNESGEVNGFQIGLVNRSGSGIQIGTFNFNKSSLVPLFPLINFSISTLTNLSEISYLTDDAKWTALAYGVNGPCSSFYLSETKVYGIQLGMPRAVNSNIFGIATGFLSECEKLKGFQMCILRNKAANVTGGQLFGLYNKAKEVKGLQMGLINNTRSGLQIGLLNFNERGFLPIFPLFNFN